jgi:glycosyltransferase involved in cell wall biosynthesis
MALGKPVIATRFGGTTELIQDQENGFLIDAFNPGQLSERIIHLIDQPEQSGKIGAAARSTIKSKFSIEQMTERFISEYLPFIPKNDLWVYENTNDRVTAA